ncbi:hypothetical protein ABPG72_018079 [Tetrahymena utriculariae]
MNHRNSNYKLNRYNNNNNNTNSYPVFRQDNQNRSGGDRGNYNQGGSNNNNSSNSNNNPNNYYNNQNPSGGNSYQSGSGNHGNYGGDNYQNSDRRSGDNRRGGGYGNKDRYASSGDNYHGSHGGNSANSHHGNGGYQNNNNSSYNQGGYSGNNHSSGGNRGGYHHNDNRRQHNNNNNSNNNNSNLNNQRGSGGSGKMRGDRNYDRRRQERNNNRSSNHYSGGNQGGSHHGGNHRNNAGGHHGGHGHHNNSGHNNYHHQSSSNNQVQNFYNNNKGFNQQERKNLETFHIRVFHNWVKSVLIQKYGEIQRSIVKAENAKLPENYLYILDLACGKGGDHKKWLMHSHACFYIGVDIAMEALNQAYQRAIITLNEIKQNSRYHSNIKFGFFQKDCSCSSEDFWKHINAPPNNALTAAENDAQGSEQKEEGNEKNKNKPSNEDQMDVEGGNKKENEENNQDDAQSPKKEENNEKDQNKDKEQYGKYMFDVVSCQMAMHYMHESEEKVRNFLDNCTKRLNDQGFLLLTFTDGNAVLDIMKTKGQPTPEGGTIYSSKHFSMKFDNPVEQIDLQQNPYGNKYGFYLQESVGSQVEGVIKYVPEYLVNVDLFIETAKEYSLEVKENNLLTDFYENNKTPFADLLKQMKVTYSQEEEQKDPFSWEVSHCYRALVFQKVLAQPNRYQFDRSTRDKYLLKYPVQLNYSPKKKED